jgi:hypothetical protein
MKITWANLLVGLSGFVLFSLVLIQCLIPTPVIKWLLTLLSAALVVVFLWSFIELVIEFIKQKKG